MIEEVKLTLSEARRLNQSLVGDSANGNPADVVQLMGDGGVSHLVDRTRLASLLSELEQLIESDIEFETISARIDSKLGRRKVPIYVVVKR